MAHADPPDISLVEVIYGYFYFLCLNPCRTQQNHFPLSGYDEILSEPQKRRKWIHQRGAGEKCQFCLWRGHSRDEAFVGEGIFWNANPLESLGSRVYRATSRAPERELGTVSSTLHQPRHVIPLLVLSRQSGNGRTGWYLSHLPLYSHKQFKGQEIYFDSWLEVFPTCNSWATRSQVWVRRAVNAAQHELMILVFESGMRASDGTQWIKALATKLEDLICDPRT